MTSQDDQTPAQCATPLDPVVLTDYWLALLPQPEVEAVEEHLFECDYCGDRLRELIELSDALKAIARSGSLRVVVGEEFVRHAAAAGLRLREYAVQPGESVQCTVAATDDFVVVRYAADLRGAARVDLSFLDPHGVERHRMTDIPVSAQSGMVVLQESTTFAKGSPSTSMTARLVAVDATGDERLLGEYTLHHTRTIPGPAAWDW